MANYSFHAHHFHYFQYVFIFFHVLPSLNALIFNYPNFSDSNLRLNLSGDAEIVRGKVALTKCLADEDSLNFSVGHAIYPKEMRLWDHVTGKAADFVTNFSFKMWSLNQQDGGDGFAFFIAPNGSSISDDVHDGCMGLISNCSNFNTSKMVAVEFDTNPNKWDPISNAHVGININSITSAASLNWDTSMKKGSKGKVRITYDSQTSNLSVFLTFHESPNFIKGKNSSISYQVNLSEVLPEKVTIGFSSASSSLTEVYYILSWEFNSTDLSSSNNRGVQHVGLIVAGIVGGFFVVVVGIISISVFSMRKITQREKKEDFEQDDSIDHEFENESGPRRFSYFELVQATDNFADERKLGEGGFGAVYRGFLPVLNLSIAVKRVSKISNQGRKEYISEVKIISKLRHKNLVQLIGWCHKKGEFLLVYELMRHGSLDSHLFRGQNLLSWPLRYKIALGLASALLYLHEESEQCVVHRDIKSSNVMLDSNFNAKLGDFGLARFMNQESGLEITGLAGTLGYMAPEYISTGQVGKRSDVFSFGVVALEIASGRRSIETKRKEGHISLTAQVWNLYENGRLLEVADEKLCMEFDMEQMMRLLIVGLWCAHPTHNLRPSIRQALQVLNFEAPFPNLCKGMSALSSDIPISPSSSFKPVISNSVVFIGR
ncbi:L-type lectin-domain containing receptor kinase IX.1-like [Durio zibethinus]|uniref:non-specific serine/threonine protein kinase n=1 Tax=Durio zibethinus TaxID=66656 RepID=A0A6P6AXC9_DURZI|nr:L-type lectin-domain containing receptor kinase IX.1-like [Durio zibethinus]